MTINGIEEFCEIRAAAPLVRIALSVQLPTKIPPISSFSTICCASAAPVTPTTISCASFWRTDNLASSVAPQAFTTGVADVDADEDVAPASADAEYEGVGGGESGVDDVHAASAAHTTATVPVVTALRIHA